jgi:hypothetical protein
MSSDLSHNWRGLTFAIAICAAGEMFFSAAARSQAQNWGWCTGRDNPTIDQRIAACTAIIEARSEFASERAKELSDRGLSHDYEQAIRADPGLAAAYSNRCGARIATSHDLQTALDDCDEALRLQPTQVLALANRGYVHLKLDLAVQAIGDFDAALSHDARHVLSLYGRGLAKWRTGDASGAAADINAARKRLADVAAVAARSYGAVAERDLLSRVAIAFTEENPMIFAIARGGADACGPGCNEWIAADGSFDQGVETRFRNFLDTLKGRKPPIFFNSTGGSMSQSYAIGRLLREQRMTASVGATFPEDCRKGNMGDESCRQIVRTSQDFNAQLRVNGSVCHSACVYALIGASVRQIPPGAVIGVHAPVRPSSTTTQSSRSDAEIDEQLRATRRQYALQMGVDPDLVELTDNTPHDRLHILTRDEIVRFQIETPQR